LPVPLNRPHDQAERELIYRTLWALKLDVDEIKNILLEMQGRKYTPENISDISSVGINGVTDDNDFELKPMTIAAMERDMIKENLRKFGGNRRKTARALQISERTLYRKIKEYGL
jgi:DNA-binding NtrC family response regulator